MNQDSHPAEAESERAARDTHPAFLFWERYRLDYVALVLAVFLVWGHSVSFQFVWDDAYFIENLQSIRSLQNLPQIFYSLEAQSSYPEGFKLFRPLRTAHYAVLTFIGGGAPRPWLFHLANLLWHCGAIILFYKLLCLLIAGSCRGCFSAGRKWWPLLGALAFAVHPVVSETVCWAKCLDDLMAGTFTLGATVALLQWQPTAGRRHYLAALTCFLLAVYSKVSAVPFAFFSVFLFACARGWSWRTSLRYGTPFILVAIIFLIHRHCVIGQTRQTTPISGTYAQTLLDMVPVSSIYLRLLTGLPPFRIDYSFLRGHHELLSWPVLEGALLILAMALLVLWSLRKTQARLVGLGIIWFALFMLPVSNLVPQMQFLAERFLYLPLIGVLLAACAAAVLIRRWQLIAGLALGVLLVWGTIAHDRARIWQDEVTLFVQSSLQTPPCERVVNNAVAATFRLPHMRTVYRADQTPGQILSLVMQGPETLHQADWPKVHASLMQLKELFPEHAAVNTALGLALVHLGKPQEALPYFEQAARKTSREPDGWTNLGLACQESGDLDRAEKVLQHALELEPDHAAALKTLAAVYWQQADYGRAAEILTRLQEIEPANPEHAHWLKEAFARLGHKAGS